MRRSLRSRLPAAVIVALAVTMGGAVAGSGVRDADAAVDAVDAVATGAGAGQPVPGGGEGTAEPDADGSGTTHDTGVPTRDIIPKPNSGQAPSEAGDRGGALQIAVLAVMVGAVAGIGAKVARDARRARAARVRTGTGSASRP